MMDEIRNHDPMPTEQEREWLAANPFPVVLRLVLVAGVAVVLGVAASQTLDDEPATTSASASAVAVAP
jgi:hypothetical protein